MSIIRVALDVPLDVLFDYISPSATKKHIGARVQVPFRRKLVTGVIIEVASNSSVPANKLKSAICIFSALLDLFRFCSDYYHSPLGEVVMNGLPARLRSGKPFIQKSQIIFKFRITDKGHIVDTSSISNRSYLKRHLLTYLKESGDISVSEIKKISPGATRVLKQFVGRSCTLYFAFCF